MAREAHITNIIIAYLKHVGFWTMKIHGGPYQVAGIPDILAIKDGRAFWYEVKRPGGKVSSLQLRRINELRQAGCVAEVVSTLAEVVISLESEQKRATQS